MKQSSLAARVNEIEYDMRHIADKLDDLETETYNQSEMLQSIHDIQLMERGKREYKDARQARIMDLSKTYVAIPGALAAIVSAVYMVVKWVML